MSATDISIIMTLGVGAPMCSAVVCWAILITYSHSDKGMDALQRRLCRVMSCVHASAFLAWLGIMFYMCDYNVYVQYNPVFCLVVLLNQVFVYRFIHILTETEERTRFSPLHYIVPAALFVVLVVWSFFVPYDVQMQIVERRGDILPEYFWYSVFYTSNVPAYVAWLLFYFTRSMLRVRRYSRAAPDYSADEGRSSVGWIRTALWIQLLNLPISGATFFMNYGKVLTTPIFAVFMLIPVIQYVIFCYNLIDGNYVIISSPETSRVAKKGRKTTHAPNRQKLEKYLFEKKPYLDPKFKITDLATTLCTNRTYLSTLINREYGMNFSSLVNGYRLRELERIRHIPIQKGETGAEIVMRAGFSNYRGYLRAKKWEEKTSRVNEN